GSILFVGHNDVGKTELDKQLAIGLFGNKDEMIRHKMGKYRDTRAVSKMIGKTAGYDGYDDNSITLTEKVR
ncbi:AAA family ATPase, partial [Staphylococcus aureus]